MTLVNSPRMNTHVSIASLPEKQPVARMILEGLTRHGFLDPVFLLHNNRMPQPKGARQKWDDEAVVALQWWCYLNNVDPDPLVIPYEALRPLISEAPAALSCAHPESLLAYNLALQMEQRGLYVNRALGVNTVYLEGVSLDGTLNKDRPDEWNDLCVWFKVAPHGLVTEVGRAVCTTEPGKTYTISPLHPEGCARLAFGQYKAWASGLHQRRQPALVQRAPLKVHRDLDRSMTRSRKDPIRIVTGTGINQHSTGPSLRPGNVGPWSAGCLVKYDWKEHLDWLEACNEDYRAKPGGYLHVAALLDGALFYPNMP